MRQRLLICLLGLLAECTIHISAQSHRPYHRRMAFVTDTVMVHDPVMAYERGTYYLLSTGNGLQWATSKDRRTWVVQSTPFIEHLPEWTHDSVPGFRNHVWAPDIIRWRDRWWLAYSCSTFGKNTSAIGLMTASRLNGEWQDEGCLVASREKRDDWNAIDPAFIVDDEAQLWLSWGSFWDGIQISRVGSGSQKTIARRCAPKDTLKADPNPTSKYAGRNAIEAPFIFRHGDFYYLFVSWDYCCRGAKSNYRVAVGRSKKVDGPYVDREGRDMLSGGGVLFFEGDKTEYEAAGHCAVYDFDGDTIFICHGYSATKNGVSLLIQRPVSWTDDGWPTL